MTNSPGPQTGAILARSEERGRTNAWMRPPKDASGPGEFSSVRLPGEAWSVFRVISRQPWSASSVTRRHANLPWQEASGAAGAPTSGHALCSRRRGRGLATDEAATAFAKTSDFGDRHLSPNFGYGVANSGMSARFHRSGSLDLRPSPQHWRGSTAGFHRFGISGNERTRRLTRS